MVVDHDVENIRRQLDRRDSAQIALYGAEIHVRAMHDASKLALTTQVYTGSAYIPSSIRTCLKNRETPFNQSALTTFLIVDEPSFSIFLHYLGDYEEVSQALFKGILEEFAHQAAEWRLYLDEKDRHDRVHARAR